MTNETDCVLSPERAAAIVAEAEAAFDTAVAGLREAVAALKELPDGGEKDVAKDVRAVNGAFLFALEMREKACVAALRKQGGTGGGGGALDLDAARDEIAFRLACLREAGGGGGVPGQPD